MPLNKGGWIECPYMPVRFVSGHSLDTSHGAVSYAIVTSEGVVKLSGILHLVNRTKHYIRVIPLCNDLKLHAYSKHYLSGYVKWYGDKVGHRPNEI